MSILVLKDLLLSKDHSYGQHLLNFNDYDSLYHQSNCQQNKALKTFNIWKGKVLIGVLRLSATGVWLLYQTLH